MPRLDGLRVAMDCGHGASAVSSPEAFARLGADVTVINDEWNGIDINTDSGSTHLGALVEVMQRGRFDLGIAHDGDADRVIALDENGDEVDGDMIMAICGARLQDEGHLVANTIVSTVMCNLGFEIAMRERGITVIKTKVGDRYVLEQMQTSGAVLGGEQSGHIIFMEHNTTGDGLTTAIQLAVAMQAAGKPLSELKQIMRRYPQVLVNVPVGDKTRLGTSHVISDAIKAAENRLGDTGECWCARRAPSRWCA